MAEQAESICIPFTYTYDQFTTFFCDGRVYLSGTSYPIGRCCVEIANMDEEVLGEIDRRVEEFIPVARALLTEKTNSAVAFAQETLNAVWDIIFTMPVYRDLNMDLELSYHSLERLYEQKEKWAQVQDVHKENESEFFVAEKTTFHHLHDFLRTEFYRGLAIGNAAAAKAMQILEQTGRGELTDDEMKNRFRELQKEDLCPSWAEVLFY